MPYGIKNSSKTNDSLGWFVCQLCIATTSWRNVETCPPFTTTYFCNFRSITKAMKSCLSKLEAFIITNHLHVPFAKVSFSLLCFSTIFVSCVIIFIVHYMCFIIFTSITKACCSTMMLHYRFCFDTMCELSCKYTNQKNCCIVHYYWLLHLNVVDNSSLNRYGSKELKCLGFQGESTFVCFIRGTPSALLNA